MRKRRILGKPGAAYHVISRFVDRQFALGSDTSKRVFLDILKRQAAFSGVEILTYCLMGNHFHLLVRVTEIPELPERLVLERLAHIWSPKRLNAYLEKLARLREISAEGERLVSLELDRQRKRMHNLSEFVKDIKQRFSIWFNRTNNRKGTLFEERFKSVLVQSGRTLRLMAAYIELNPVRAGIVSDPVDYPWCGYAQAVGGNKERRQGIRQLLLDPRTPNPHERPWKSIARSYRLWLVERGMEPSTATAALRRRGSPETRLSKHGKLAERCPPRSFSAVKLATLPIQLSSVPKRSSRNKSNDSSPTSAPTQKRTAPALLLGTFAPSFASAANT